MKDELNDTILKYNQAKKDDELLGLALKPSSLDTILNSPGALKDHDRKSKATGTFSAFAATSLSGEGGVQERIEKNTARTAKASEDTRRMIQDQGGLAFG